MPRLRRSVHFVSGANERLLHKSLSLPADSLVLDLEDSVTPENKDSARLTITGWLSKVNFGRQEKMIRMNPLDTPWGKKDLEVTMQGRPDSYLVPKVRTKDDVLAIDAILSRLEKQYGCPQGEVKLVVIATETPHGVLNIKEIATACPRLDALTWGAEDLSAAIGARRNRDEDGQFLEVFRYARVMTLLAATAAGIEPLDTAFVDIPNTEGLRRECVEGAWMGFTGKITIHPSQIPIVNEIFCPSPDEVAEAKELVAAFEQNQEAGRMAFTFRGQMVDVPHLTRARKILARAEMVGTG